MRILFCTEFFHSHVGGAESILRSLVSEMVKRSHHVTVCSFESSGPCGKCASEKINHIDFRTLGPADISLRAVALMPQLNRYDVVFTHHYYHFSSLFAAIVSRYHHVPLVLKPIGIYARQSRVDKFLYECLESTQGRVTLKTATLVLPTSRFEAMMLEARGVPKYRIRVIPSGVSAMSRPSDSEVHEFAVSHGISSGPLVLFVGRLEKLKGVDTLLHALTIVNKSVPDVQCLLAGKQDDRFMVDLLSRKEFHNIRLIRTGFLSSKEIAIAYSASTVFVLPSLSELSSLTLKEAQLARLPVITTRVGGNPEYVFDGVNGILVEPGSATDLAKAIVKLIKDEPLRARMGSAAFEAASKYALDSYVRDTADAISQVATS